MRKLFIALFLVSSAALAVAQGQGDVWFFGDSVILDFGQGAPVLGYNARMASQEGSSTLCTPDGRLLLYTNGWELFDSTRGTFQNWVIPNMFYLGNDVLVNGSLLLPINDSIVYFFAFSGSPTVSNYLASYYARINLNRNGGLGMVESSHNLVGDSLTEHFAAIRDATNEGWWILSHKTWTNKFVKWHIDQNGAITKSFQSVGAIQPPLFVPYVGQLVFNSNGDRLALGANQGLLEYYSFDRCSGELALLNTIQKPPADSTMFFGISFSPSGKLLYASDGNFGQGGWDGDETFLFQYEIDAPNILATQRKIWTTPDCDSCRRSIGHHKLGPDGKIYMPHSISDYHDEVRDTLMAINFPDSIGVACGFNPHAVLVKPGKTNWGLPNIPDYRMKPLVDQVAACGPDILLCKNDSVRLGLPDTSGTLTFQWWPAIGLSDPTAAQPWASPSASTTYHLMVVDTTVHSSCDNTIDSVRITIVSPLLPRPVALAGNDTVVCAGVPLQLGMADTSGGTWAYAWSPSGGLDDAFISNPTASLNASQQYVLMAYRPEVVGSCQTDRDTVAVTVYDPSVLPQNPAGPDIVICIGDTVALGVASSGFTYDWTGANLSGLQVAQPLAWPVVGGIATVSVTDYVVVGPCGTIRDTVGITVEQPFMHDAPLDVAFCVGECFQIGVAAVGGYLYSWTPVSGLENPAASLTKAQPTATTTYTLTVTNPAMQSANCRERRFNVTATADGCEHQSFIAVNGDNVAEVLDLGDHAGSVSVKVFDMAGKLVFLSTDYQNDWSATMLAHGLYVYRVEVGGDCPSSFVGKIAVMK